MNTVCIFGRRHLADIFHVIFDVRIRMGFFLGSCITAPVVSCVNITKKGVQTII